MADHFGVPRPTHRTNPTNRAAKKKRIVELLSEGATRSYVCREVEISSRTLSTWLHKDEKFALAVHDADKAKLDKLLEVAFNRALDPKDPRGDILLMFQIKQLDPSFRENAKVEHSIAPGLAKSLTQLAKMAEQD